LAAVVAIAFGVRARADDLPLFTALKNFCVYTDGVPGAVKSTVEMAGGKQVKPPVSTGGHYPQIVTAWLVAVADHKMLVSSVASQQPYGNGRVSYSTHCILFSYANEDNSIEAIRRWVGVRPSSSSQGGSAYYDYQERDSVRSPMPTDKEAFEKIMAAGRARTLMIVRPSNSFASIELTHFLGISPAH
jgi:hypothetical protein